MLVSHRGFKLFALEVLAASFLCGGCGRSLDEILGKDHRDDKSTLVTTQVDGVWLSKDIRINSQNDPCHTRLIVTEGKALLGQTCGQPEHLYHLIAYGEVETVGSELKINVEEACPQVSGIAYPKVGSFNVNPGKNLSIFANNTSYLFTAETIGQLGLTDSATVGCFGEVLVIQNNDWVSISSFAKRALAPYKSAK